MNSTPDLILRLPLPPSRNREGSRHWAVGARLHNTWAETAFATWAAAGRKQFAAVKVEPHFYLGRIRDDDNAIGGMAFKGILDGLKGNLVPDDDPSHLALLPVRQEIVPERSRRLELWVYRESAKTLEGE